MTKKKFVILTLTRSGSTWLLSLLNGQRNIAAYEELFLWHEVGEKYAWVAEGSPERYFTRRHQLSGLRAAKLWQYLREVEEHRPDMPACGFKLMVGQLREVPELLPVLAARQFRVIALVRDNLFEGAVSRLVMGITGDAHGRVAGGHREPLQLDPALVVREMRRRQLGLNILTAVRRTWPCPSLEVQYSNLVADRAKEVQRISDFLGVEGNATGVESALKRRIDKPYDELITNIDDVRAAVIRAGFGRALSAT